MIPSLTAAFYFVRSDGKANSALLHKAHQSAAQEQTLPAQRQEKLRTKIIVARDEQEEPGTRLTCSICESEVDLEGEGGIAGNFGICPVAFCVWCYASIVDMVSQGCLRCQEEDEDPPTIN